MPKKKEKILKPKKEQTQPVIPKRIQTAEGWKRNQLKKNKSSKD